MELKKRELTLALAVIIAFAALNMLLFYNNILPKTSGMSINELPKVFKNPDTSVIAFFIQWVLIFFLFVIAVVRYTQRSKDEKVIINYEEKIVKLQKAETDIDLLYSILKEKKKIKIGAICKIFKITKEKALEWGKILESNNLAVINYPAFSDPEIEIAGNANF